MLALCVGWEWGMSRAMVNASVFADLLSGLAVSFTRRLIRRSASFTKSKEDKRSAPAK